jgi:hypothetical protein
MPRKIKQALRLGSSTRGRHGRLYGADFVKGVPQGSYPFSRPSVSLFDLAAVSSPRPAHPHRRRAQERSRMARSAPPRGSSLTAPSTTAHLSGVGMTTFEGSPRVVDKLRPHPCMRWARDPDHDAVMRIAAKLRGGGPILYHGIEAMRTCGTPPPRTVIGEPVASRADRGRNRQVVLREPPFSGLDAEPHPRARRHRGRSATGR